MLQEGDKDQPVVHPVRTCSANVKVENHVNDSPEIRHKVEAEDLRKSRVVYPGGKSTKP
jgi:hypothetical protein